MKLPNKYGSVYKLSGKRRKPWAVRKTVGWKQISEKMRSYPIYEFIGYYATRTEALQALADYNENPYDLHFNTITFEEVYDKWSEEHFKKVSASNINGYKAAFNTSKSLWKMKFVEIKLDHLQKVIDDSGKNTPTLKKLKIMYGLMTMQSFTKLSLKIKEIWSDMWTLTNQEIQMHMTENLSAKKQSNCCGLLWAQMNMCLLS